MEKRDAVLGDSVQPDEWKTWETLEKATKQPTKNQLMEYVEEVQACIKSVQHESFIEDIIVDYENDIPAKVSARKIDEAQHQMLAWI